MGRSSTRLYTRWWVIWTPSLCAITFSYLYFVARHHVDTAITGAGGYSSAHNVRHSLHVNQCAHLTGPHVCYCHCMPLCRRAGT